MTSLGSVLELYPEFHKLEEMAGLLR